MFDGERLEIGSWRCGLSGRGRCFVCFVFSLENQRSSGKIEHPCTCPLEENDQGLRLGLTDKIHLAVIFIHPFLCIQHVCDDWNARKIWPDFEKC